MTESSPEIRLVTELQDNLSAVMRENRRLREEVWTKTNTIRILEERLVEVQQALARAKVE
jgi:hypothetical protein